jgi:hypothetical protein
LQTIDEWIARQGMKIVMRGADKEDKGSVKTLGSYRQGRSLDRLRNLGQCGLREDKEVYNADV